MIEAFNPDIWSGRSDPEDGEKGRRWHHVVRPFDAAADNSAGLPVVLGFCCDEGVRRNQGRVGARGGPDAIRRAMANLACSPNFYCFDRGNVHCVDGDLDGAQSQLAGELERVLQSGAFPVLLGGGHELAWATFQGLRRHLSTTRPKARLGIINFDAHFDLRDPNAQATSGTPFRQCYDYSARHRLPLDYLVLGLNPAANTEALFDFAAEQGVVWMTDTELYAGDNAVIRQRLESFIQGVDCLYLSVCLDVFSACCAPGVSAPAAAGIQPLLGLHLIYLIKQLCSLHQVDLVAFDIAEMNPLYDRDQQTAKLAARIIYATLE